jgi:hypothetical protein
VFGLGLKSEVQRGGVDVVRLSTRVAGQILKAVLGGGRMAATATQPTALIHHSVPQLARIHMA